MENKKEQFADLFKKFRLRSEFATLSEFADALAQEGLVYEESLFSHWQKGDRVPKDRHLLLTLLKIFIKKGGVTTLEEANLFLATANQRDLDKEEVKLFSKNILNETPFTAPAELPIFVGRERHLKEISWRLLNKESILLHGEAGVGKTALAIKIAHTSRNNFRDGVLWYRSDIKGVDIILNDIAKVFGEDVSRIKDNKIKSELVKKLLSQRSVLLIFDNVSSFKNIDLFLPTNREYPILLTSKQTQEVGGIKKIKLSSFSDRELISLAKEILGLPFVIINIKKLKLLGALVGYSPLALMILMRNIAIFPRKLDFFIHYFENEVIKLYKSPYDNKTLNQSLNLSFNALPNNLQEFFISLGIFFGPDFSKEATAYINKAAIKEVASSIAFLQRFSLVEQSAQGRYRLHPLIKIFSQSKIKESEPYNQLALYYLQVLSQFKRGSNINYDAIEKDLDNILGVFEKCYKLGFYKRTVELWKFIGVFLWDKGYWIKMKSYVKLMIDACKKIHDNEALALCYARELSWLYFWQGDIKKAENFAKQSLTLGLHLRDDFIIALSKQRLGMISKEFGKLDKARKLLREASKIFKELNMKSYFADTLLYLGHVFKKQKRIDLSLGYYQKSLSWSKNLIDHEAETIALYYLGEIYLEKNLLKKSVKCFKKALFIDLTRRRKAGIGWCSWGLGKVQVKLGKNNEAQEYFLKAKKIFTQLGMKIQIKEVQLSLELLNEK